MGYRHKKRNINSTKKAYRCTKQNYNNKSSSKSYSMSKYRRTKLNQKCNDNNNCSHINSISDIRDDFNTELYNYPFVYKNADELAGKYHRRDYMNYDLRYVRSKDELRPPYKDYKNFCSDIYNYNTPKYSCGSKHECNPKIKTNCDNKPNNNPSKINQNIAKRSKKTNNCNCGTNKNKTTLNNSKDDAFLQGKGLYAPFKGLYMKW